MSYAAPKGPKFILRIIAGMILAAAAWMIISIYGPRLYTQYQWHHIKACESKHGLLPSDKKREFGFDNGGWHVIANNERTQGFADCVRDRLNVPVGDLTTGTDPIIGVSWNSARLHPTIDVYYRPGDSSAPAR